MISDKDTIYRQDAIKYFAELWECIKTINDKEEWEDVCITTVNEIKSAEPKRKKGHWVYYDEYAEAVTHTCSECGKRMTTAIGVKASYCWNCGADMKEPFTIPTEIIESVIGYDD